MACSTTTLALGSRQLAKQGAIVTRLTAIEEMAGMTLLCSDKTGTLTLNAMIVQVPSKSLSTQHEQEHVWCVQSGVRQERPCHGSMMSS